MAYNISEMDSSLLRINNKSGPFSALERSRVIAQVLGPNCQDSVSQAVQAQDMQIADATLEAEAMGYIDPYKLFSWMSYNIAKGDPNCGNYFTWASLTFEGNIEIFKKLKDKFNILLKTYNPYKMPIHPDLSTILENRPFSTHFSSQRIPKLTHSGNHINVFWPGNTKKTFGNPPSKIAV